MAIHPTAIVHPQAHLDSSVDVGPHAIIEQHVQIGAGTTVGANAFLTGHTTIGRDNQIHIGAVIGHEPQDVSFQRETRSYLRIGDRNVFREYSNVHRGTEPESATVIGNDCFIMAAAHIAHNCVIGNNVIICNCALVAGHVHVGNRAFISGGVVIHQFTHVGQLALLSGNARVSKDVPPFTLLAERNEIHGLNLVGLKRAKIAGDAVSELKRAFRLFYRSGRNISEALTDAGEFQTAEAKEFVEFIRRSPNGICPLAQRNSSP